MTGMHEMGRHIKRMVVGLSAMLILAPSLIGFASESEPAKIQLLIEGSVGEWRDVHHVELISGDWRNYDMDFVKRVEKVTESRIRIHRVHGPPPLEVEISPPSLNVFWPDSDGNVAAVTESTIERLDVNALTDWSILISFPHNGEEFWMEMILAGDAFTYLIWQESPKGDRRYVRIHLKQRLTD